MSGRARHPIITLTTDFGLTDSYVAQMKVAIAVRCPQAVVIDMTHLVPRHDILAGSFAVERALATCLGGTIHVAVVDPGVGSDRKLLAVKMGGQILLCPDNGVATWAIRRQGGGIAHDLTWRPPRASRTFHGRDILAPVAAILASGAKFTSVVGRRVEPVLLDVDVADGASSVGTVVHIDVYGNATTNVAADRVKALKGVRVGRRFLKICNTYADVSRGKPLSLIASSDLLEIAVREGSAAEMLNLRVGSNVTLVPMSDA